MAAAAVLNAILWSAAAVAFPRVEIGLQFDGSVSTDTAYDPPDTMGAVGPNHIVELINGQFAVYRKADGGLLGKRTLERFWTDTGVAVERFPFDPRILYDATADRWLAISVDAQHEANSLMVAASHGGDPLGQWSGLRIPADPKGQLNADFPTLGMSRDYVVAAASLFAVPTPDAAGSMVVVLRKAALYGTPWPKTPKVLVSRLPLDQVYVYSQPIVDFDEAGAPSTLWAHDPVSGAIRTGRIEWAAESAEIAPSHPRQLDVPVFGSPPEALQPDIPQKIDPGTVSRFGANVVLRNGGIWAVGSVDINGRSALRWYEIGAKDFRVRQSGVLASSRLSFYYASIAVNEFDEIVIGCSGSSPDEYVSSYAFVGYRAGHHTVFSEPILLQAGESPFRQHLADGRNRWGDYTATVIDPVVPRTFWTFQQVAREHNQWSIGVTQLKLPEPSLAVGHFSAVGVFAVCARLRRSRRRADAGPRA